MKYLKAKRKKKPRVPVVDDDHVAIAICDGYRIEVWKRHVDCVCPVGTLMSLTLDYRNKEDVCMWIEGDTNIAYCGYKCPMIEGIEVPKPSDSRWTILSADAVVDQWYAYDDRYLNLQDYIDALDWQFIVTRNWARREAALWHSILASEELDKLSKPAVQAEVAYDIWQMRWLLLRESGSDEEEEEER
jgi:hypothetical protein